VIVSDKQILTWYFWARHSANQAAGLTGGLFLLFVKNWCSFFEMAVVDQSCL
jgi:hypothetical protein